MKLFTSFITLLVAGAALAAPTVDPTVFDEAMDGMLVRRDAVTSCDECNDHLGTCMKYGHGMAPGIVHCADICNAYLCRKWPDCRNCDIKLNNCPGHLT